MASNEEVRVTLSPLDYIPPANYVRLVFPLPLKPGVEYRSVFDDLHEALHRTFIQEPWASGKVIDQAPTTSGWRPGQRELRYKPYTADQPRPYQLRYHELKTNWTYATLKEHGFPSDIFPEEELLQAAPRLSDLDAGADVLLTQANFLPGGLLLALTTSHAATDAGGMLDLMQLWASHFRTIHGEVIPPVEFTPEDHDRSLAETLWQQQEAQEETTTDATKEEDNNSPDGNDSWLRGLVCLDTPDDHPAPTSTTSSTIEKNNMEPIIPPEGRMLNRIRFLSGPDLAALRNECLSVPRPAGVPPPSTSDCINALLWRGLMRARAAARMAPSNPRPLPAFPAGIESIFESPVDVRHPIGLPPHYMGNCFVLNTARLPLDELLSPNTSLGTIALALRKGAARLDGANGTTSIRHAARFLRAVPDWTAVRGRFVERPHSADVLVSNLMHLPLSNLQWGGRYFQNEGRPDALRVLHGQYAEGVRLAHVLPRDPSHKGVEISLNLFKHEWELWDQDPEVYRYIR